MIGGPPLPLHSIKPKDAKVGLSIFTRQLLGPGSFPQLEGQELPDSAEVVKTPDVLDDRAKVQGRKIKLPKQIQPAAQPPKI